MKSEQLDARILAELAKDSGTLLELAIRTETDTTTLLPCLQALGSLKRVRCTRDEGRLVWELVDQEAETATDGAGQDLVHVEQPAADVPAPAPAVPSASLTDRLEAYVAEHGPITPAQAIAAFPDAKASSVYSLLSQLVAAKRLVGEKPPGGGFKRYRVRGERLRIIRLVLTVAHLDHQPENCDPANLRAWCQRCHLAYDQQHHAETAAATRRAKKASGDLFTSSPAAPAHQEHA